MKTAASQEINYIKKIHYIGATALYKPVAILLLSFTISDNVLPSLLHVRYVWYQYTTTMILQDQLAGDRSRRSFTTRAKMTRTDRNKVHTNHPTQNSRTIEGFPGC